MEYRPKNDLRGSAFSRTAAFEGFTPFHINEEVLNRIKTFKSGSRKNDPARLQGIHGPYEELMLRRTGKLPPGYYSGNDPEPWGMLIKESRSNILWQALSGLMDRHPEFGANYLGLSLDNGLDGEAYGIELKNLNKSWGDYLDKAGVVRDHVHSAMRDTYHRVSCPACTMLTSLVAEDRGLQAVFREIIPLSQEDRRNFLVQKGFIKLLDMAVLAVGDNGPKLNPGG